MEGLGINPGVLLIQIISFLIVFVILRVWLFGPLARMMENRQRTIAKAQEDARIAAEARANAEKEAAQILAEAQAKAAYIVREATDRAEEAAREIRLAAEAEIAKARENALAEAEAERNRMLSDLRGQVAALAIAATQKLIGEALDEKRQHALINEFFSGVKAGKVVVLENVEAQGTSAEVISALPLTAEEEEIVRKDLLAKVGAQAVTFRVDPKILGGLVIKIGDKVLDGSVAAQLEGLRQALK